MRSLRLRDYVASPALTQFKHGIEVRDSFAFVRLVFHFASTSSWRIALSRDTAATSFLSCASPYPLRIELHYRLLIRSVIFLPPSAVGRPDEFQLLADLFDARIPAGSAAGSRTF